ncbi:conserved exported hypothetical protein [Clostridium neonatale]|uniref:Uncharacterized protein n=3 Tax=Clostridium TaxID=1485 RepID=A0ABY6ST14_9CLOT|nr:MULTISPECIES: hypothetical protein [Clostridium]MDU4480349.1 hypothetical protein [Clostridium sp.]CAI3561641.1 conserved exported hypothetical protein [Clostridium neonatale]VDG71720.1 Uncharacterised protein [Clostridium carnis]
MIKKIKFIAQGLIVTLGIGLLPHVPAYALEKSEINTTTSESVSFYESNKESAKTILTEDGTFLTEEEFEMYLSRVSPDEAFVRYDLNTEYGVQTRAAAAVIGIYFVPGIGEFAILATGTVMIAGVLYVSGTAVYNKVKVWQASGAAKETENAIEEVPNKLKVKNKKDVVDLGKFKDKNGNTPKTKNSGTFTSTEDSRYTLSKDTSKHLGVDGSTKAWKLNKSGKRVASLNSDGKIVGK